MMKPRVTREPPDEPPLRPPEPPDRRGGAGGAAGGWAPAAVRAAGGGRWRLLNRTRRCRWWRRRRRSPAGGRPGTRRRTRRIRRWRGPATGRASEIGISLVAALRAGAPTPAGAAGIPAAAAAGPASRHGRRPGRRPRPGRRQSQEPARGNGGPSDPRRSRSGGRRDRARAHAAAAQLGHAQLELLHVLGRFVGPVAQRGRLARLGEVQQDEDRQSDDGGESGVGAHRGDEMVHREGKWDGCHGVSGSLRGDTGA